MNNVIKKAGLKELALYVLGRRTAFLIEGDSMLPTLTDGDRVLVANHVNIEVGDVVLAKHPYKMSVKIVKRISSVGDDGRLTLIGDNPDTSTDSRAFGTVSLESVIGKVTSKLR